jgi:hypothetical protein
MADPRLIVGIYPIAGILLFPSSHAADVVVTSCNQETLLRLDHEIQSIIESRLWQASFLLPPGHQL